MRPDRRISPWKLPSLVAACMLGLALSACSAHAGPRHRAYHPHGYVRVVVHGRPYFYHHGYYYRRGPRGYFIVGAPGGVVVPFLPVGAIRLRHGPVFYHYYGGVYYQAAPGGYVVVSKPDTVFVEKSPQAKEEAFVEPPADTVLVHNDNGSETPVRLERVDGKWRGPRGEMYPTLPDEAQLRSAYGL